MLLFWFLFSLNKEMKSLHKVERQNLWSGIFYFFLVPNMWIPCMSCHFELWSVRLWIMVSWFLWEMWVGLVTDAFKFMEMCVHYDSRLYGFGVWWWWCRELVQIWTHCCRGFGKWQHHIGVQKTRCKHGYAWRESLLLHLLPQESVLVSITLEGTSIMHLQVSNKKSSQTLCHLINLVGAAATETHPTATLRMLWLQSFFSLYLQIVIVENSLQFCRCVIFSNRSRSCWICCTHFILGQKVC